MSAVLVEHRNAAGVLLRYEVGGRHSFHDDRRPKPSDRLRMTLLRAEKEVRRLTTIVEHLEVSDAGGDRIVHALRSIEAVFTLARAELGMARAV
jgi:hypothetical protein